MPDLEGLSRMMKDTNTKLQAIGLGASTESAMVAASVMHLTYGVLLVGRLMIQRLDRIDVTLKKMDENRPTLGPLGSRH